MFQKLKSMLSKNNESEYIKLFNHAAARSKESGLGKFENLKNTDYRLLNEERFKEFYESISHLNITPEDLAAQCMPIHLQLKPFVDEFFGTESVLTIGHIVRKNGDKVFYENLDTRLDAIKHGYDVAKPLNIHAWLTLPTCEILDFTFYSTLSVALNKKELEGLAIGIHADDETADHKYVPEFLGDKFLEATGILRHYTVYEI